MAKRYIGDAVVTIRYVGLCKNKQGLDEYQGQILANGQTWHFDKLFAPAVGFSFAYDSPDAYDKMAASAVSFGSYYTTHNRGDDVPEWAPSAEIADAIDSAAWDRDESGEVIVRRRPNRAA